jgi:hypothetical protein
LALLKHQHLLVEAICLTSVENELDKLIQVPIDLLDLGFGGSDRSASFWTCNGFAPVT